MPRNENPCYPDSDNLFQDGCLPPPAEKKSLNNKNTSPLHSPESSFHRKHILIVAVHFGELQSISPKESTLLFPTLGLSLFQYPKKTFVFTLSRLSLRIIPSRVCLLFLTSFHGSAHRHSYTRCTTTTTDSTLACTSDSLLPHDFDQTSHHFPH
mmetsp:Transcript_7677/g.28787  ORF Transcript_7677/g.28787 Transcript_7677/m.28787 type:complete len:154 (-) Transcript_7677:1493-1954(-)